MAAAAPCAEDKAQGKGETPAALSSQHVGSRRAAQSLQYGFSRALSKVCYPPPHHHHHTHTPPPPTTPGRLDKILYVPLPPPEGRASILRALTRRTPLAPSVDLEAVGASPALTGFSGADLAALVRACVLALKESLTGGGSLGGGGGGAPAPPPPQVLPHHFAAAMARVQPSVSRKDQRMYDGLRLRLRSARGHLKPEEEAPGMAGEATAGGGAGAPAPTAGGDDMLSADNGGGGDGGAPMEEDPVGLPA